jgi:hypothetical protein
MSTAKRSVRISGMRTSSGRESLGSWWLAEGMLIAASVMLSYHRRVHATDVHGVDRRSCASFEL